MSGHQQATEPGCIGSGRFSMSLIEGSDGISPDSVWRIWASCYAR